MIVESEETIAIAGAGRVARVLGRMLADAGEPVTCVVNRNLRTAAEAAQFIGPDIAAVGYADVPRSIRRLLIAVPDRALEEVASALAGGSSARVALHTCGARGPDALAPLASRGIACGTLHPLQTISGDLQGVAALRGIAFAVWGDAAAVAWAERIAVLVHGEVLRIAPELRPLYHVAAVMASNYVMALLDAGQTLMEQCGIERAAALRALGPLLRRSVENALERGPVNALTGPIERGDEETVSAHLAALKDAPASIRELYLAAGRHTVDLARRRGLDAGHARDLEKLLTGE